MSTTRLRSPKAPATERPRPAVLLCGYGASDAAAKVARCVGAGAAACYLFGSPGMDEALRASEGEVVVVPFLMADGVTCAVLRRRVSAYRQASGRMVRVTPPLGEHPGLTEIIDRTVRAAVADRNLSPESTSVLLVAHGTVRHPASLEAARRLGAGLSRDWAARAVACLESRPSVAEAAAALPPGPVVSLGLFLDRGNHARVDLPSQLAGCGRIIVDAGCLGEADGLATLVSDLVASTERASGQPDREMVGPT